ncbi:MAG: DUF2330 domain-containing protein [Actinomycetota bacterium]
MRKAMVAAGTAFLVGVAGPAWACGGLIAPNGAVGLVKTATLAAYADGVEHYVTQFEFAGAEGEFGSIVPLPGVPDRVVKGGEWTLERLAIEVQPVVEFALADGAAAAPASRDVEILEEKRIGALDITILRGGGRAVGDWAGENGFDLTPDAPEVLEFYARRSPVFMAAKFDATEAARRGLERGEGTSIHLAIPTDDPWVPLRILALGQTGDALVEADVFLLTERQPELLPGPVGSGAGWERDGLELVRDEPASPFLLTDLAGDRGMGWLPTEGMWLSYLQLSEEADELRYDLAIDAGGGQPSVVDAGLLGVPRDVGTSPLWVAVAVLGGLGLVVAAAARRQARATT